MSSAIISRSGAPPWRAWMSAARSAGSSCSMTSAPATSAGAHQLEWPGPARLSSSGSAAFSMVIRSCSLRSSAAASLSCSRCCSASGSPEAEQQREQDKDAAADDLSEQERITIENAAEPDELSLAGPGHSSWCAPAEVAGAEVMLQLDPADRAALIQALQGGAPDREMMAEDIAREAQ